MRFEVDAEAMAELLDCNCSICSRTGFLHLIVPREQFRLLAGRENLVTYTFNTRTAKHYFCGDCGIKSFYVPRSHPDGYSVNARCIDGGTAVGLSVRHNSAAVRAENLPTKQKRVARYAMYRR